MSKNDCDCDCFFGFPFVLVLAIILLCAVEVGSLRISFKATSQPSNASISLSATAAEPVEAESATQSTSKGTP